VYLILQKIKRNVKWLFVTVMIVIGLHEDMHRNVKWLFVTVMIVIGLHEDMHSVFHGEAGRSVRSSAPSLQEL